MEHGVRQRMKYPPPLLFQITNSVLHKDPITCYGSPVLDKDSITCYGSPVLDTDPITCYGSPVLDTDPITCYGSPVLDTDPITCYGSPVLVTDPNWLYWWHEGNSTAAIMQIVVVLICQSVEFQTLWKGLRLEESIMMGMQLKTAEIIKTSPWNPLPI